MKIKYIALVGVLAYLISAGASASNKNELSQFMLECAQVNKDAKRLACFDRLVEDKVKQLTPVNVQKAPVLKTNTTVSSVTVEKVAEFSKQHLRKTAKEQGLDSITSKVNKLKKLLRGQWIIDLENGQQWRQKDGAKIKLNVGDTVQLKKGSMGSVYLYVEGKNRSIRVKRLK
ncbi:hypothetical protein NBRC116592_36970 [Colwellia sp. KU-HH00111]|uniref:hypothetical protein n=1 Tax=Colwellia sp. KU-HH00111 TaxID=3127652 RepID=UPI00310311AE